MSILPAHLWEIWLIHTCTRTKAMHPHACTRVYTNTHVCTRASSALPPGGVVCRLVVAVTLSFDVASALSQTDPGEKRKLGHLGASKAAWEVSVSPRTGSRSAVTAGAITMPSWPPNPDCVAALSPPCRPGTAPRTADPSPLPLSPGPALGLARQQQDGEQRKAGAGAVGVTHTRRRSSSSGEAVRMRARRAVRVPVGAWAAPCCPAPSGGSSWPLLLRFPAVNVLLLGGEETAAE